MYRDEMHSCSIAHPDQLQNVDNYEEDLHLNPNANDAFKQC